MTRTLCKILALASFLVSAVAQQQVATLQSFTGVSVCTPFNVLIAPSPAKAAPYALHADAGQDVKNSLNATVTAGVLYLSAASGQTPSQPAFSTSSPIKITVSLPADQLSAVSVSAISSITVAVAQGFAVPNIAATLQGTSDLTFLGIAVSGGATILNSGTGSVVMVGQLPAVAVTSAGTGSVYLSGASGTVVAEVSGVSNLNIIGAATTVISGQVSGLSSVQYSAGTCTIATSFGGLGAACTQAAVVVPPQNPQWSCGLQVYGSFGCLGMYPAGSGTSSSNGGTSTVSSSSTGTGGTSVSSFSTGGGSATASASSNGNTQTWQSINGVTTQSTGGTGAALVTNTGSLKMLGCPASTPLNMI